MPHDGTKQLDNIELANNNQLTKYAKLYDLANCLNGADLPDGTKMTNDNKWAHVTKLP